MTDPLAETDCGTISLRALEYGRMDALLKGKTVLALGPGISRETETSEFVRTMVARYKLPMVVDADGLNAFEGCAEKLHGRDHPLVITPHPGEMARLCGSTLKEILRDRINVARTFAREHQCVTVLKGHRTLIAEPGGEIWVNTTGNPGMATGGTGDVLTGITAGLCAQAAVAQSNSNLLMAVIAAVHLHGLAGDLVKESGDEHSLTATDLLTALPATFRRLKHESSADLIRVA
jgi:NAD(P)H-hydrate epimerase